MYDNSLKLYNKACELIPGGVNSPARAFKSVETNPVFIKKALGSKLYDVDNNEYIDYIGSWGPMILGHNNPDIIKAVKQAIENGSSYGLPTENEIKLAEIIIKNVPSIDKIRLTTSGTEAAMTGIRLARAFTKKNKIIKFKGCYHGHSDSLLVQSGSASLTLGNLDSNGITKGVFNDTITIDYNNIQQVEDSFVKHKDIACIIIEPIAANMGIILPENNFLQELRKITIENNALLIFDEVITGFRASPGGAQELYNVIPDITILGKIIGGGYPIGAFGGKKEIMNMISPVGNVYHAGTLSGNPVSVAAGIATLEKLTNDNYIYNDLENKTKTIINEIQKIIHKKQVEASITGIGSLFTVFFTGKTPGNLDDAKKSNTKAFSKYFKTMLNNGIMLPPSQFEANFVSTEIDNQDIEKTLAGINKAMEIIK